MKTLELFNAVLARPSSEQPYVSEDGFIIEPNALWAKEEIITYYEKEKLSGNELNKTFHKSWEKIKSSTRYELLLEQIQHYLSTYGSNFQDEIYIPDEVVKVPEMKLTFKVIKAYSVEELTEKCLSLLKSGIALKEETIDDLLSVLTGELNYKFTGKENIRNKEAIVKIADYYKIYPENPVEFFRYVIFKTTESSLLIKNKDLKDKIKNSQFNPSDLFESFGLKKMAQIFNRFKPLFLAYKNRSGKNINRIAKLSKTHHKPLISNPLNDATSILLEQKDLHWLDNATPFALFKALSACYLRINGQDTFVYRIRNGKSYVKKAKTASVNELNFDFILTHLKSRFDLSGKKFYFPDSVEFSLPTSEKMFVGNFPQGTKFSGEKLAVGIYWKDEWGACDLDLSGLDISGKTGWDARYSADGGNLMFSGDITSAPDGAVEYLYANRGLDKPVLVMNNVYSGSETCSYKIVIGKGDDISKEYMMNPNNLLAEVRCNSIQKQTVLGMMLPEDNKQTFVLLNFGAGHSHISGHTKTSTMAIEAVHQQWRQPYSFNELVKELGATIIEEKTEADFDFSLESLERSSFIEVFKETSTKATRSGKRKGDQATATATESVQLNGDQATATASPSEQLNGDLTTEEDD